MNIDETRATFLSKEGAWEDYPFDSVTAVFKVGGKMFGLMNTVGRPVKINLKCIPDLAADLRDVYKEITPGYHMNKKHWITVDVEGDLPAGEIVKLIDLSYDLVVKKK